MWKCLVFLEQKKTKHEHWLEQKYIKLPQETNSVVCKTQMNLMFYVITKLEIKFDINLIIMNKK